MNLLTQLISPKFDNDNQTIKSLFTYKVALVLGVVSLFFFIVLYFQYSFFDSKKITINEYKLLFIPVLSLVTVGLLKKDKGGVAKLLLILGALFFFNYFALFFGGFSEETLLLNPIIVITLSAFSQFIFDYKKERYCYFITTGILFLLVVFFNEIFAHYQPTFTFEQVAHENLFIVRLAYIMVFLSINFIIYYSVKINEKYQAELDINNAELDDSRANLLNQNMQMKEFQNEIINQNKDLKSFTEELQTKNELIAVNNQQFSDSYLYINAIKNLLKNETKVFHQYIKDFFIYDKSIAQISSNLFWSKKLNDKLYFALADSDGNHASSSVFSVLIIKLINIILAQQNNPVAIIEDLIARIEEVHSKSSVKREKRVLDIILCSFDKNTKILEIVSLNQNVFLSRKGKLTNLRLEQKVSEDKRSSYQAGNYVLEADDILYLYTNSCTRQKGDPNLGELGLSRFSEVLKQIMEYPLNIQEEKLRTFMDEWRGEKKQEENMKIAAIKID